MALALSQWRAHAARQQKSEGKKEIWRCKRGTGIDKGERTTKCDSDDEGEATRHRNEEADRESKGRESKEQGKQ